jgi:phytoene synthase
MPVFGAAKGEASDRFALSLGDALQLTNILRDVAEDAAIGRLYLPAELLTAHGAAGEAGAVARVLSPRPSRRRFAPPQDEAKGLRAAQQGQPHPEERIEDARREGCVERRTLAAVARDLAEIANQRFADARAALKELDWRTVRPALLMMGVYEAYLKKLEVRGWDRIGEPLSLSKAEKLLIAARYWLAPPQ